MYEEKGRNRKKKKVKNKFILKKKLKFSFPQIKRLQQNSFLKKINWKLVITKLGILFLVIIFIMIIISRLNQYHKKEKEEFNQNIKKITDATLAYYGENKLPIHIGDSSSIILEEMIQLKKLEEIKEKNKVCNYFSSYVIVTKIAQLEYRIKIYLKCPEKEKIIEKKFSCKGQCKINENES